MILASNPYEARRKSKAIRRKSRLPLIRPSLRLSTGIRRRLQKHLDSMVSDVEKSISTATTPQESARIVEFQKRRWQPVFDNVSETLAREAATGQNDYVKAAIIAFLISKIGTDVYGIVDEKKILDELEMYSVEFASLIKTIPSKYLGSVANAIYKDYRGEKLPEGRTLSEEIFHIGGVSKKRADFIVHDQISKMNSAFVEEHSKSLGSEEYVWKARMDYRTVGNPSGLYPKGNYAHNDHYHRDGKTFSWDNPPPDGHPGRPINCRCEAIPVIKIENIFDKN